MRDPGLVEAKSRQHYPALDGLRGVAILLVMTFHFGWAKPAVGHPAKLLVFFTNFGWSGVDLFFVLSGFLITGILLDSKGSPHYFKNFYARRALRIFPAYYAVLAVTLVILPMFMPYATPGLKRILHEQAWLWAYSTNIGIAVHGDWVFNAHPLYLVALWSLAVEEHFYLVWPTLVSFVSIRTLARVSIAVVLLAPIARALALGAGVPACTVYCLTPLRADALALGGLLACAYRTPAWLAWLKPRLHWGVIAGAGLVAIITARRKFFPFIDPSVQVLGYSALALFYGSTLLAAVTGSPTGRLGRVLSSRILRIFGKYSYGAYLIQDLLRPAYDKWVPVSTLEQRLHSEVAAFILHSLACMALTISFAFVSYELFERQFLKLKRFFD
jgi:peptidoglycan/LPS O-acetylase OafA/YrhL